jgi:hypothetical protein
MSTRETPLASVPSIPPDVIKRLAGRWITSVEQLVALGGSEARVRSLADDLALTPSETQALLDRAASTLDPATAAALRRPVDTSRYRTGAHKPNRSSDDGS